MTLFNKYEKPSNIREFFSDPKLWEDSRVDGYNKEDMVDALTNSSHMISYINSEIACITACTPLEEDLLEAHTFVPLKFRSHSFQLLSEHIDRAANSGYKRFKTYSTDRNKIVMNYLIKRLGFVIVDVVDSNLTVDGMKIKVYTLIK